MMTGGFSATAREERKLWSAQVRRSLPGERVYCRLQTNISLHAFATRMDGIDLNRLAGQWGQECPRSLGELTLPLETLSVS